MAVLRGEVHGRDKSIYRQPMYLYVHDIYTMTIDSLEVGWAAHTYMRVDNCLASSTSADVDAYVT